MEIYLVFSYSDYYPGGGWHDFDQAFGTLVEAIDYARSLERESVHVVRVGGGQMGKVWDNWTK